MPRNRRVALLSRAEPRRWRGFNAGGMAAGRKADRNGESLTCPEAMFVKKSPESNAPDIHGTCADCSGLMQRLNSAGIKQSVPIHVWRVATPCSIRHVPRPGRGRKFAQANPRPCLPLRWKGRPWLTTLAGTVRSMRSEIKRRGRCFQSILPAGATHHRSRLRIGALICKRYTR
ncbi:hypothetical protein MCEMSEM23_02461 [Rhabdaerophilaceae bacterium]